MAFAQLYERIEKRKQMLATEFMHKYDAAGLKVSEKLRQAQGAYGETNKMH